MKRHFFLALSLCCFLLSGLCLFSIKRTGDEALAARISPAVLRFHVLANSDSPKDQQLKMAVKSLLVERIHEDMAGCSSKEEMCLYLTENRDSLISLAENYIRQQGFPYEVTLTIEKDYFPSKTYGNLAFPCGIYDAARLVIGKGKGHNWWCVLYPSLCFIEPSYAAFPASSQDELKETIGDEDFHELEKRELPSPHIKFLLPKLLGLK